MFALDKNYDVVMNILLSMEQHMKNGLQLLDLENVREGLGCRLFLCASCASACIILPLCVQCCLVPS